MTSPSSTTTAHKTTDRQHCECAVSRGGIFSKPRIAVAINTLVTVLFLLSQTTYVVAAPKESSLVQFDIPRQSADDSLPAFGQQANVTVIYPFEDANKHHTNRLFGRHTLKEGIHILLKDSGLSAEFSADGHLIISNDDVYGESMMKSKKNLLAAVIGSFVGVAGVQQVVAQNEADSQGKSAWQLEEIIVTAQKREQALIDVPIAIGTLGGEELNKRGIGNLEELSLAIPELTVNSFAPGQATYQIRGIGASNGDSLVGVYLDEVPVTGIFNTNFDLRTTDLERVEVLYGPQGTLYGQGSAGGTIRFITKNPKLDSFGGEVGATAYFTEGGDPSKTITGIVNLPVVDDVFAIRVAATYEDIGGWVDTTDGRENVNDSKLSNIRIKGLWRPSDVLDVNTMIVLHRNDAGFSSAPADKNYVTLLPEYAPGVDLPNQADYDIYNLTVKYDLGFAEFLSSSSYSDMDIRGSFTNFFFGLQRLLFDDIDYTVISQEFRLASVEDNRFNWSLGANYTDTEYVDVLDITGGAGSNIAFQNIIVTTDVSMESFALFGDLNYEITEKLTVGVGMRYFEEERVRENPEKQEGTFDTFDPRLYVSYSLTDDIQLYGSIADGFRSGGFNASGQEFSPTYDPETVRSYELGAKMSMLDGRFDAEVALFHSEYSDIQTGVVADVSGNGFTENSSGAEVDGVDISMSFAATENLLLKFSGNVIDTEITELPQSGSVYILGDQINSIPDYSFTVSTVYDFNWASSVPGYVRLDYNQQGKAAFVLRSFDLQGTSDEISLLNMRIGGEWHDFNFEAYAQNLLAEKGLLYATVSELDRRPQPKTVGFSISRSF